MLISRRFAYSIAFLQQRLTGGEDHFPADQPLLNNGELGQF